MSFAYPTYLYLLLLLPVFALLFWWARAARKRSLRRFGKPEVVEQLMPDVSPYKPWIKFGLEMLLLALAIIILARPRAGMGEMSTTVHGIETVVAMDVSNSMNAPATTDPQDISRLQRAKRILEKLLDRFTNNKVALVVFAGNAYMQMPLTADVGSAKMFINGINTSAVPAQGTAIGAAIDLASGAFSQSEKSQKAIIVITDGENFEDDAVGAAKAATERGIQVDVIGVGTTEGVRIPIGGGNYFTDESGEEVKTALNEEMAQKIAKAGRGVYVNGNASDAVEVLQQTLDKLSKTDLATFNFSTKTEQFPVFAWIALFVLLALLVLTQRKNPWLSRFNFFTKDREKND